MAKQETVSTPTGSALTATPSRRGAIPATVAVPAVGLAGGLAVVLISRGGAHGRPAIAGLILVAAVVAALLPFRYGLPIAVFLAAFEGFILDFVGSRGMYWNEVFAAIVVGRSLVTRRPSRTELLIGCGVAVVYGGYVATGSSLTSALWGAKVLLISVAVGWAIARLGVGWREWRAIYWGLAAAALASVVVAGWQRAVGIDGLADLGVKYGLRIREVSGGGALRAYGGFTSPAPFSYMLAITICCWVAFLVGQKRDRRVAFSTMWLPGVALAGIVLAVDRTAVLALLLALLAFAVRSSRKALLVLGGGVAVAVALVVTILAVWSGSHKTLSSASQARMALWGEYLSDFRPFGEGPATAGSEYGKVAPKGWAPPLRAPHNWNVTYRAVELGSPSQAILDPRPGRRPRITLHADARSIGIPRRLTVSVGEPDQRGAKVLLDRTIVPRRWTPVALEVPAGRRAPSVLFVAPPLPTPRSARSYPEAPYVGGELVNLTTNPSFERGTVGWRAYEGSGAGTTISRETASAAFGSSGLEVANADATADPQGAWYRFFQVTAGSTYTASFSLRGAVGGEVVFPTVTEWSGPPTWTQGPPITLGTAWRRYTFEFTARRSISAALYIRRAPAPAGAQTFFIDGVQIEQSPSASSYCDGSLDNCRWAGTPHDSWAFRGGSTDLGAPLESARAGRTQTLQVGSTWLPMPQTVPFTITIGGEEMEVTSILGLRTYRVKRGANRTITTSHAVGDTVRANVKPLGRGLTGNGHVFRGLGFDPLGPGYRATPALPPAESPETPVASLAKLRFAGLPAARTPAERVWYRWFEKTPAALQSDGPGLVDNLYVLWIYEYGVLGLGLCVLWLAVLLWPATRRRAGSATQAAASVGVFLIVSAVAVSVWEEAPTDLLAALIFAAAWSQTRRKDRALPAETR